MLHCYARQMRTYDARSRRSSRWIGTLGRNMLPTRRRVDSVDIDKGMAICAGFVLPLTEQLSVGMTGFVAGFGSPYKPHPVERFGADGRVTPSLNQLGLSTALAYELIPDQTLGLSLKLSDDVIEVAGVQSLALFSATPQRFSDQGRSDVFGVGFAVTPADGWTAAD